MYKMTNNKNLVTIGSGVVFELSVGSTCKLNIDLTEFHRRSDIVMASVWTTTSQDTDLKELLSLMKYGYNVLKAAELDQVADGCYNADDVIESNYKKLLEVHNNKTVNDTLNYDGFDECGVYITPDPYYKKSFIKNSVIMSTKKSLNVIISKCKLDDYIETVFSMATFKTTNYNLDQLLNTIALLEYAIKLYNNSDHQEVDGLMLSPNFERKKTLHSKVTNYLNS